MPHADSPAKDASTVPEGLESEIRAVEAVFTSAADALLSGREQLFELTGALASYRAGLSEVSATHLVASVETMITQFATVRASFLDERGAISAIDDALVATARTMARLQSLVQTLQVFTSTARVVEAESGHDEHHAFSHQIKVLSACSMEGLAELQRHSAKMREQTRAVRARQDSFGGSGLAAMAGLSAELQALAVTIVPGLDRAGREAGQTAEVAERLNALITAAVTALQAGDSFRQRLEHALAALRACPDRGESPDAHDLIRLVVAAQLSAAGQALGKDLRRLSAAMDEISGRTAGLVEWSQTLLRGSDISRLLQALQDTCGASLARLYASQAERRLLDGQVRRLRAVIQDMQGVIAEQTEVDDRMKMGSYNVLLRSRTSSSTGSAMAYVAKQIGELIDACLAERRDIVGHLEVIPTTIATSIDLSQARVSGRLEAIGDRLSSLAAITALWRGLDSSLRSLTDLGPAAIAAFARCAARMEAQRSSAELVQALAAEVRRDVVRPDAMELMRDPRALRAAEAVRLLYSVPEEREVHDRLCGHPVSVPEPEGAVEDEIEWF